ncbi:3',5'-cyclic-AMP phosphodiesterase [Alloalcanivorax xenomutans]|uniref:3',5'-cyclic-AMP phosphodiesterase n=1 Tax=Alloalcanivorax xenomutans TaxID=1094342 RepID=UPI000C1003B2|nr:3',5'-cyclic-AMP phosphodiesterase [Alloalcanivorax xenomutans]MCE7523199.1 3',5'-cyclic-AMP phosphodiesterase [Alloalcanivorax xenomutans]PHS67845.1 MAG: 3',5'-cyclic-AMP phosphodiesterase [Alcanivorax sp.]
MSQPVTPVRVVQLSDFHLFADPASTMLGLNTQHSLETVLRLVRAEQPDMRAILATGDLSQDGSEASYTRLKQALRAFGVPVYWLEGNHDETHPMRAMLADEAGRVSPCVGTVDGWRVIMLDSTIPGQVPGELFDRDLVFLEQALMESRDHHVMICLHHHPVPMGSRWLDEQQVANSDAFFRIVDQHPQVRAVLWGHVHQEYESRRKNVRLLSVPSTCVQFKPHSADFALDQCNPGYRWLDLYPDGRIESGVSRVQGMHFTVDLTVNGY